MSRRFLSVRSALSAIALVALIGLSAQAEDAAMPGDFPHASGPAAAVCVSCHEDGQARWAANRNRPCTPYCLTCHKKAEMDRHHTVGTVLATAPEGELHLTAEKKVACVTCHEMARNRYDEVRWKATSLFDRMFHQENQYKTYFLVMRNDRRMPDGFCRL